MKVMYRWMPRQWIIGVFWSRWDLGNRSITFVFGPLRVTAEDEEGMYEGG